MVELRLAVTADLPCIASILEQGRRYLQAQGLPQWQHGYGPDARMAEKDIVYREGYVLTEDEEILGYAALTAAPDESYAKIMDGDWEHTFDRYLSIHRVAMAAVVRGRGLSRQFITGLLEAARALSCHDIRIDTYPKNHIMEKVILRAGFVYRGKIVLPIPNGERNAYQIILMG